MFSKSSRPRRLFPTLLALSFGLMWLAGCENPPLIKTTAPQQDVANPSHRTGSLRISINLNPGTQLQYVVGDVDHVDVTLKSGALTKTKTITKQEITSGNATSTIDDLIEGEWWASAMAYSSANQAIGGASAMKINIVAGEVATANLKIELNPIVTFPTPLPTVSPGPGGTPAPQKADISLSISDSQTVAAPFAGVVTTLAGSTSDGWANGSGINAKFNDPRGLVIDSNGNIFVCDTDNHLIRKVTASGYATTFAGNGTAGYADGLGGSAQFDTPRSIIIDGQDNLYVAEGNRIRKISPTGTVTTLFQSLNNGYPVNIVSLGRDADGSMYFATTNTVHRLTAESQELLIAGNRNKYTSEDGKGEGASLYGIQDMTVRADGTIFVIEYYKVRKITPDGYVTTLAGGGGSSADGYGSTAGFSSPQSITLTPSGQLLVGENNKIRMVTQAGAVATLLGNSSGTADGDRFQAKFYDVRGLAFDNQGRLFVSDRHRVRYIR